MKVSLALITFITLLWVDIPQPPASSEATGKLQNYASLKAQAFEILETKCNICHKRQNPFMIFTMKNMDKRAEKINEQVIETRRMPKGDEIKLTTEEYSLLKNWLSTQINS